MINAGCATPVPATFGADAPNSIDLV